MATRKYTMDEVLEELYRVTTNSEDDQHLLQHMVLWFKGKEDEAYREEMKHFFFHYGPERPQ